MLQPWLTLFGDVNATEVIQAVSDWLDARHDQYTILVNILKISANCDLYLETAIDVAGPWRQVGPTYSAEGFESVTLSSDNTKPTDSFDRYLRWKVDPPTGTSSFSICFQLKALPGDAASRTRQNPRRA